MFTLREVISQKFWIVDDKYGKIGTVRSCPAGYEFYDQRTHTKKILNTLDDFKVVEDEVLNGEKLVDGFPTKDIPYIAEHDVLPVYKKTEKGKAVYAAGYYIVKFDGMGWQWAFCPKIDTLNKYPYKGPFRTEWEMNMELNRHKKSQNVMHD
jgi:hypothetical protein